jgi:hypothetical protein
MAIQVFAEGPTLVISLGTYVESKSVFRHGMSIKDSADDAFQKVRLLCRKIYQLY